MAEEMTRERKIQRIIIEVGDFENQRTEHPILREMMGAFIRLVAMAAATRLDKEIP